MYNETISFIRETFQTNDFIPLHEPRFIGKEKLYLNECIDSTFVSSVGKFVDEFENKIIQFTSAKHAVAAVNGTAALHVSLVACGVNPGDLIITQPFCFIATSNAISYTNAIPTYVDIDKETMSLSPEKLEIYLKQNAVIKKDGFTYHKTLNKKISCCIPMHSFGHPARIDEINMICEKYNIILIEDAAESLGSYYKKKHTGIIGKIGVFSFNGNKTITCGGGGMIVTNDHILAKRLKHLTTTAKVPHPWDFEHDEIGYNYRLPNINAALACAQMENLPFFLKEKRKLAGHYKNYFENTNLKFISEPEDCISNYWLNAILLPNRTERDNFLKFSNEKGVMTRPAWILMNKLKMFKNCPQGNLDNSLWLEDRLVNIPSSVILKND